MAITATAYGPFGKHLLAGDVDLDTASLKVTLHTSAYTPNKDHEFFTDAPNEVAGTGYTAGGVAIGALSSSYDAVNDRSVADGDDVQWTGLDTTYRYAVVRVDTGAPATDILCFWVDFGADQVASGIDVSLQWDATGFLHLTA